MVRNMFEHYSREHVWNKSRARAANYNQCWPNLGPGRAGVGSVSAELGPISAVGGGPRPELVPTVLLGAGIEHVRGVFHAARPAGSDPASTFAICLSRYLPRGAEASGQLVLYTSRSCELVFPAAKVKGFAWNRPEERQSPEDRLVTICCNEQRTVLGTGGIVRRVAQRDIHRVS